MSETDSAPHTLFIKAECRYCTLIKNSLEDAGLLGDFSIVDVGATPVNPRQISHVPTIVADRQHKLTGRDAFAWVTDYINKSPQYMTTSSSGKCTGWDSMSSSFTFIEGQSDTDKTNSSMSAVYSNFSGESPNVHIQPDDQNKDRLTDAVSKLQDERNSSYQTPRRA